MDKSLVLDKVLLPIVNAGYKAYLVGGCVRDYVMGVTPHDYDVVTSATPEQIHTLFTNTIDINSESFGIVVINIECENIEIATMREDRECDGRHTEVSFTNDYIIDAQRRDFTMNALYEDVNGNILDPTGLGLSDIKNKKIRFVGDMKTRCDEDNLRALRAIRFLSKLGFEIVDIVDFKKLLNDKDFKKSFSVRVSNERIGQEMIKLISGKDTVTAIKLIIENFNELLPDNFNDMVKLPVFKGFHTTDNLMEHTLVVFDDVCKNSNDTELRISALLHDIGKLTTQDETCHATYHDLVGAKIAKDFVLDKWKFTKKASEKVYDIIASHMEAHFLYQRGFLKLFKFMRKENFDLILILLHADCVDRDINIESSFDKVINRADFEDLRKKSLVEIKPIITGDTLIKLGYKQSPEFKRVLSLALDEQMRNFINGTEINMNRFEKQIKNFFKNETKNKKR